MMFDLSAFKNEYVKMINIYNEKLNNLETTKLKLETEYDKIQITSKKLLVVNKCPDPRKGARLPKIEFINKLHEFQRNERECIIMNARIRNRYCINEIDICKSIERSKLEIKEITKTLCECQKLYDKIINSVKNNEKSIIIDYDDYSEDILSLFTGCGLKIQYPNKIVQPYEAVSETCSCFSAAAFYCAERPCITKQNKIDMNKRAEEIATICFPGRIILQ